VNEVGEDRPESAMQDMENTLEVTWSLLTYLYPPSARVQLVVQSYLS
jgi:hypothetical protein